MTARDILDGFLVFLVIALLLALYAAVGTPEYQDDVALEKSIAEVDRRREMHPCDGATLKQWAAGERWAPKGEDVQAECAPRAKRLPPHILTSPLGSEK